MEHRNLKDLTEAGFSLLELVIAIAVILVLTIGGLIGYGNYQDNARQAMVESAADQARTGGVVYESNHNTERTAEDAVEAYNSSSKVESVHVELDRSESGCLTFTGTYKNHNNKAVRTYNCSGGDGGTTTPPAEDGAFIRLANACSYDKGVLGVGAKVIVNWEVPKDYKVENVMLQVSTSGLGSELKSMDGFNLAENTESNDDGSYTTKVPTNRLGGLLGLGSELEIALSVQDKDGMKSVSVATNAGLLGGIEANCRAL